MKKDKSIDKAGPELKEAVAELKKRKQILEAAKPVRPLFGMVLLRFASHVHY